jgi:indole-3-glycerol phosphate synthase
MSELTDEELADSIREKAAKVAESGISSYSHGSVQVSRSDPALLMGVADRLALRHARQMRGFVADCDQSGGVC